jgi:hypothetical protein
MSCSFLAAAAARAGQIRIRHAVVLSRPGYNPPPALANASPRWT